MPAKLFQNLMQMKNKSWIYFSPLIRPFNVFWLSDSSCFSTFFIFSSLNASIFNCFIEFCLSKWKLKHWKQTHSKHILMNKESWSYKLFSYCCALLIKKVFVQNFILGFLCGNWRWCNWIFSSKQILLGIRFIVNFCNIF